MGCLQSKSEATETVGERRRLSVLKGGPEGAARGKDESKPVQLNTNINALLELLPPGDKRFSVLGQHAAAAQKGFENKNQALVVKDSTGLMDETNVKPEYYGLAYACKKGLKPESPNQDDFFVLHVDEICGLYGVFDGHGPYGHEVSNFAHQQLPLILLKSDDFKNNTKEALKHAFLRTHQRVQTASERMQFDCQLSGTTGTVVWMNQAEDVLWAAHVGDSRAIMAQRTDDGNLKAIDLTNDHKPGLPEEKARIHKSGGQVRCLNGDVNERVFIKNRLYPGLAMSRSIGDLVGASVGVTAEPEISKFNISMSHEFFLICTDGVWEFISSQEAIDIIKDNTPNGVEDAPKAAEKLAQEAWDRWIKEEGNVVDDITVVLVYLKGGRVGMSSKIATSSKPVTAASEEPSLEEMMNENKQIDEL